MIPNQPPLNTDRLRETRNNFIKEVVALNETEAIKKIAQNPMYPSMVSESMTSLELTEEETEIAKQIIETHRTPQTTPNITRDFLLLSTLLPTYMIPILPDLEYVPDNIIVLTIDCLLQPISVFMNNADMEQKAWQLVLTHNYVAKRIEADPHSEYTSTCADLILKAKDSYVCLNLPEYDLTGFSKDRANVFNYILEKHELVSDKIITGSNQVVGVLISHVGGDDSTLYAMQILKDLKSKNIPSLLICDSTASMAIQKEVEQLATKTLLLPKGIKDAIQLIQEQNLDILILTDSLHDAEHPAFLLATQKLAKHQLALQNTIIPTGFTTTDYILLDSSILDDKTDFPEHLHGVKNLSGSLVVELVQDDDSENPTREGIGITEEVQLYVSAAPMHFITPEVRSCWIHILAKSQNSKLLLLPFHDDNISEKDRELFQKHFEHEAQTQGVNRSNILILTDTVPNIQVLDSYIGLANCYLDTFPCNSQLPAARALSCGIGLVTLQGSQLRERTSQSLLPLNDSLVHSCRTIEEYIEKAVTDEENLTRDPEVEPYETDISEFILSLRAENI